MRIPTAFFALLLAFSGAPAHALVADGTHWPKVIQALREKGIDQVGDLDLQDFARRGHDVHFYPYAGPLPSVLTGSRESAFFLRNQNKVYVRQDAPRDDFGAIPQLELHEVLGALGYDDSSTALSSALVILSTSEKAADRATLLKEYGDDLFTHPTQVAFLEGGSSVGGGGDLPTIDVKAQVLEHVRRMQAGNPELAASDFFRNFPRIDFEPMRDPRATQVSLRYRFVPGGAKRYGESFTVLVPISRWERSAERAPLLGEISGRLLELFASSPRQAAHEFTPSGCAPSVRVSFPVSSDPGVLHIQDFRAGLIHGCQDLSNLQALETVTPAPPEGALPAAPGSYHFACDFTGAGIADGHREVSLPEGRAQGMSIAISPRPGQFVFGRIAIDANGNLVSLALMTQVNGAFRVSDPEPVTATSGLATLLINGAGLRFQCEKH